MRGLVQMVLVFIVLLTAIPGCLNAQKVTRAAPQFIAPRPASPANGFISRPGFAGFPRHHFGFYPFGYFSSPFFYSDPFFYDDLSSSGYPVAAMPPVIIMQAPPSPAADFVPDRPASPAQPLVIELQGDRYVRISGEGDSGAQVIDQGSAPPRWPAKSSATPTPAAGVEELAPAILIFRDGHREEVSDYTIADGILYARGNYYTDGSWNRKVELSSLNLPETVKSNQSRGVRFQIPTAPNEVIVRP